VAKTSAGRADRLTIDGHDVAVTNLDKVLYPENGFTKAQVIDYYIRVSQYLLPHFENRPVTLNRFPDGVRGHAFYEKKAPAYTPEWVQTFPVPRRAGGPDIRYILIDKLATLVWCANVASLELHPFLHCAPKIQQPTSVVFDLDPGEGTDLLTCAEVAFLLKDVLRRVGLEAVPKVSGSKGLQIYVPLNTPVSYAQTQPFARRLADVLTKEYPKLVVAEMAKNQRAKKVFIDWSQNSDFKTTVGVYSLRAKRDRPFASLPVKWEELEAALKGGSAEGLSFEPEAALKRLSEVGDLFAPVLRLKQSLPASVADGLAAKPTRVTTRTLSKKRFVVQKHAASHLHYDFRLEMHDVLKSWAVPKGVPYELEQRRLAMATEDHPLEYLDFEGTIPEGQYGGGTVMVWDIGTYELIEGSYYKGELHVSLSGKKLKGEWQLRKDRKAGSKNWYLSKTAAALKPPGAKKENASALTGRTLDEIAREKSAQWHSNRTSVAGVNLDELSRSPMKFVEPMQCELVTKLPEGEDWQYELKLDGYRALAIKEQGAVTLLSRRNNSLNTKFASIAEGLNTLEDGIILDGEVVALDAEGRPSFHRLQHLSTDQLLMYYVFDLLAYRGRDITGLALTQRRELLKDVMQRAGDTIRLSAVLEAGAEDLIRAVREQGL